MPIIQAYLGIHNEQTTHVTQGHLVRTPMHSVSDLEAATCSIKTTCLHLSRSKHDELMIDSGKTRL